MRLSEAKSDCKLLLRCDRMVAENYQGVECAAGGKAKWLNLWPQSVKRIPFSCNRG